MAPMKKTPLIIATPPDDHVMDDDECDALADALVDAMFKQRDELDAP